MATRFEAAWSLNGHIAMHWTLKTRNNLTLIASYLVCGFLILLLIPTPLVLWPIGVGALFGIGCGICQRNAIRARTADLIAAETAMQIRAAMMRSPWGRAGIYGLYCSMVVGGFVSFATFSPNSMDFMAGWVLSCLAEKTLRETVTLASTMELVRAYSKRV
jgi:hypothetical protein